MFIVGLTGGIASGKSTVAKLFSNLGVPIIDADVIAKEVVESGSKGLREIIDLFGPEFLTDVGELNRQKMRELIFSDVNQRKKLEAILHPEIRRSMQEQASGFRSDPYVIFVIPLLLETGRRRMVDRVLVVDCPEQDQISRVVNRDGISTVDAEKILAAQIPRKQRLALADDILTNNGDLEQLVYAVQQLHQSYREISGFNNGERNTGL